MNKRVTIVAASVAAVGLAAAFIVPGGRQRKRRNTSGDGAAATAKANPARGSPEWVQRGTAGRSGWFRGRLRHDRLHYRADLLRRHRRGHHHPCRWATSTAASPAPTGPVVVPFVAPAVLPQPGTPGGGCVTADPALAAEILANPAGFYVNFHTADFPPAPFAASCRPVPRLPGPPTSWPRRCGPMTRARPLARCTPARPARSACKRARRSAGRRPSWRCRGGNRGHREHHRDRDGQRRVREALLGRHR